ncbi:MAG TPA: sigma-70 family RNA polymerase sigma factor [bacterium]|nr:sigma-70 family RNA polymerase sigma factor [bacterium]
MSWTTTRPSLIGRLKDSEDHDAWREFDRRYGSLIVAYARRRGLDLADAEDLRQNVMISLSVAMRSFELRAELGRFRSYLGRVVGNAVHRSRERPFRRPDVLELDERMLARVPDPREHDTVWEREWRNHHLRLAMETVERTFDPRSVEMFRRLLAGERTASVAEAMDTTTAAVHKAKQRIRARLKEIVAEQLREEGEEVP